MSEKIGARVGDAAAKMILSEEEVAVVLDYLMAHKMAFTQAFLESQGLAYSGTKARLRERLEGYLRDGKVAAEELVALLDNIEGWGDQHIYLYRAPRHLTTRWADESTAKSIVAKAGLGSRFNQRRPLVLPDEPTLSTIEWNAERLRLIWVEKRQREDRVPSEDYSEGDLVWRAYRVSFSRGVISFYWDFASEVAMMLIGRLPSGTVYRHIQDRMAREMRPFLDLAAFEPAPVGRAMHGLWRSHEARQRQLSVRTPRGGQAGFTSARTPQDIRDDPDLRNARSRLGPEVRGELGNYYWLANGNPLSTELHLKIYANDQRVAIFGERTEQEVRYVLSRVRSLCREAS